MQRLSNGKDAIERDKKSGIHKLVCDDCDAVYLGQTRRNFETRYKEHIATYRNGHPEKSNLAKLLLETKKTLNNNNTLNVCVKKG